MGSLFGGDAPTPQPIPMPEAPKATPMVDEDAIKRKKKQAMSAAQARGGRQSTLLSSYGESETLG
jgi:hypothetical protein